MWHSLPRPGRGALVGASCVALLGAVALVAVPRLGGAQAAHEPVRASRGVEPTSSGPTVVGTPTVAGTPTEAGEPSEAGPPSDPGVGPGGLPPYPTWQADVTAALAPGARYLDGRLARSADRTAIVLDIDNTSLETGYAPDFENLPAVRPVLALARRAAAAGSRVYFVTGRREHLRDLTEANLRAAGYPVDGLFLLPEDSAAGYAEYKSGCRARIEQDGVTIVLNVGNNFTDLDGGHAEFTVKLPDYGGLLD